MVTVTSELFMLDEWRESDIVLLMSLWKDTKQGALPFRVQDERGSAEMRFTEIPRVVCHSQGRFTVDLKITSAAHLL